MLLASSPMRSTCWVRGKNPSVGWARPDTRWSSSSWVTWPGWAGLSRRRGLTWTLSCGTTCSEGWATTHSKVRGQTTNERRHGEVPHLRSETLIIIIVIIIIIIIIINCIHIALFKTPKELYIVSVCVRGGMTSHPPPVCSSTQLGDAREPVYYVYSLCRNVQNAYVKHAYIPTWSSLCSRTAWKRGLI